MPQLPEKQPHNILPDGSLQELAAQKEKEWRELQELRAQSLQAAFEEKDRQLNEEKARFNKLKDDFKYNLKLLTERDQELERYDATFSGENSVTGQRNFFSKSYLLPNHLFIIYIPVVNSGVFAQFHVCMTLLAE